jgi:uncharacterized protein
MATAAPPSALPTDAVRGSRLSTSGAPRPAASPNHPVNVGFADPAALGLGAFGLCTFLLSISNTGAVGGAAAAVIGMALFYGGIGQLLAGMWEFVQNNTFGAFAFSSYGAFWLGWWWLVTHPQTMAAAGGAGIGTFMLVWGVITLYLTVVTVRINNALLILFTLATVTFFALAIGALTASDAVTKLGGWLGIATAIAAGYGSFAAVINASWRRPVLPLGDRNSARS